MAPRPPDSPILPLPALSLRQMQYFVELAHNRNFTETAARLCVTQPALSAAIQQMEKQFGVALFDRSRHPVGLTEAGTAILPLAEHLLNTARCSFTDMTGSLARQAQTVRIGLIPSVATRLLATLAPLREQPARLRFELVDLHNDDLHQAVERGEVDFGIGVFPQGPSTLRLSRLWEDEIVLLGLAGDPLCRLPRVPWRALMGREMAVFRHGSTHGLVLETAASLGMALQVSYQLAYVEPLLALVRNGLALGLLPRLYTEHLNDPALVTRALDEPRVGRWIVLIRPRHAPRNPSVARCLEAILGTKA